MSIKKILVAVDGSKAATLGAYKAIELAKSLGAGLMTAVTCPKQSTKHLGDWLFLVHSVNLTPTSLECILAQVNKLANLPRF